MRPFGFPRVFLISFIVPSLTVLPAVGDVAHYQILKSFGSVTNDGTRPWTPLVQGHDGVLYGTTSQGGSNGLGTVFKLSEDGSGYEVLHHFGDRPADGQGPLGELTAASDGLLYGTTSAGGARGAGTIFRLERDGSGYTVMRSLTDLSDGSEPEAGLIEGSDGALYGTTASGPGGNYGGTMFVINKDGTGYRLLHRFGPFNSNDGVQPLASLMEGSDGVLYGTTSTGGGMAVGSVFKIKRDGSGYQKLYAFGFGAGVINPFASLLEGSDHALYGTGGGGAGGVFKLNKDGTGYQVLHGFNDGWSFAALVKGRDGALYSTTSKDRGAGTVFRLNEDGTGYEVLHTFGATAGDGLNPQSALILGRDGAFYGVTLSGGDFGRGTVFRLMVNRIPVPQCANVLVSADSNCVANASVDHGSFDPDGDPITLVQSPPGPYPLGTNRVTLTVTDSNGDFNSCTSAVIVLDTTPPSITCSTNVIVEFTGDAGAVVNFTVSSADSCDPNPAVTSVPPSGGIFPIGSTEVHSTATDASGNEASCAFTITVLGARGVKQDVLAELAAFRATAPCAQGRHKGGQGTGKDVCQKLDDAIGHLRASLNPAWWIDQTHLHGGDGELVFDEEQAVVAQLCFLLQHRPNELPDGLLEGFISRLNRADHLLASVAIQEALAAVAPRRQIEHALRFLAQGDADALVDPCSDAITKYRQAWEYAVRPKASPPIRLRNGHTHLELLAEPGAPVTVQASTNLVDWVNIGTATSDADGVLHFEDSDAASHPIRYYRALPSQRADSP